MNNPWWRDDRDIQRKGEREMNYSVIRKARDAGWEPTCPTDWNEYLRALDWEKPGDERFLDGLAAECAQWLRDNA